MVSFNFTDFFVYVMASDILFMYFLCVCVQICLSQCLYVFLVIFLGSFFSFSSFFLFFFLNLCLFGPIIVCFYFILILLMPVYFRMRDRKEENKFEWVGKCRIWENLGEELCIYYCT